MPWTRDLWNRIQFWSTSGISAPVTSDLSDYDLAAKSVFLLLLLLLFICAWVDLLAAGFLTICFNDPRVRPIQGMPLLLSLWFLRDPHEFFFLFFFFFFLFVARAAVSSFTSFSLHSGLTPSPGLLGLSSRSRGIWPMPRETTLFSSHVVTTSPTLCPLRGVLGSMLHAQTSTFTFFR